MSEFKLADGTTVTLQYGSSEGERLRGDSLAEVCRVRQVVDVMERAISHAERGRILRFIREQATKGTADYEHKLTKLVDAIERGEHEE